MPVWVSGAVALLAVSVAAVAFRAKLPSAHRDEARPGAPAIAAPAIAAPAITAPAIIAPAIAAAPSVAAGSEPRDGDAHARQRKPSGRLEASQRSRRAAVAPREPPRPLQSASSHEGALLLAATPWCDVAIDGVKRGPTPLNVRLPAGAHRVRVTNSEFSIDQTMAVVIAPSQTLRKRLLFPTR